MNGKVNKAGVLRGIALAVSASSAPFVTAYAQTAREVTPSPGTIMCRGFTTIPENSWIIPAVARLVNHGLATIAEGTYPTWSGKNHTRYEAAILTAKAMERGEADYRDENLRRQGRIVPTHLSFDANDIALLKRLGQELMPELQALGLKPSGISISLKDMEHALRFSTISPAFPDVPKSHWAFASVEKLRYAGIVIGYPAGTFSRDRP
jgi:hypothetical protein